jgi:hypothetical protein
MQLWKQYQCIVNGKRKTVDEMTTNELRDALIRAIDALEYTNARLLENTEHLQKYFDDGTIKRTRRVLKG